MGSPNRWFSPRFHALFRARYCPSARCRVQIDFPAALLLVAEPLFYTLSLSGAAPNRLFLVLPATATTAVAFSRIVLFLLWFLNPENGTARNEFFFQGVAASPEADSGSCTPNSSVHSLRHNLFWSLENTHTHTLAVKVSPSLSAVDCTCSGYFFSYFA